MFPRVIRGIFLAKRYFFAIVKLIMKAKINRPAKVLLIVAPQDFRDEELFQPQEIFKASGLITEIASTQTGVIKGMLGGKVRADKDLLAVNVSDYQAIVFVGGTGASVYFDDAIALAIAEEAVRQGKIVAAICIAPSILANAGILRGKRATAYPSERENLISKGAEFTGEPVTVDGRIVTAAGPAAAREFGWKIVELLRQ